VRRATGCLVNLPRRGIRVRGDLRGTPSQAYAQLLNDPLEPAGGDSTTYLRARAIRDSDTCHVVHDDWVW
jgi:hypothetical protein